MRLAREGWPFIIAGWGLLALAGWAGLRWGGWVWLITGLWSLVAIWLLVFFRDPERQGPRGEHLVIAPADGQVVSIVEAHEPMFVRGMTTRISIFMNVFDVHVNRYPASGTVELVQYNPGRFLHAAGDKASLDNEQASIGIRTAHGPVLIRQIAGLVARRIVTDGRPGDRVVQGARLGMIRFGSRVDVFVPLGARPLVRVRVGDRVLAGATVLMELPT
jgi:phosphatidylserine decarboxylase